MRIGSRWMVMATSNGQAERTGKATQVELSTRQCAILHFIGEYGRSMGHSPSLREIGQGVGITSSSHISYHVQRLVRWGYLGRKPSIWRSLFLLKQGYEAIGQQPEDNLNITLN